MTAAATRASGDGGAGDRGTPRSPPGCRSGTTSARRRARACAAGSRAPPRTLSAPPPPPPPPSPRQRPATDHPAGAARGGGPRLWLDVAQKFSGHRLHRLAPVRQVLAPHPAPVRTVHALEEGGDHLT